MTRYALRLPNGSLMVYPVGHKPALPFEPDVYTPVERRAELVTVAIGSVRKVAPPRRKAHRAMPPEWDGIELRELIADSCAANTILSSRSYWGDVRGRNADKRRLREYRNEKLTRNL